MGSPYLICVLQREHKEIRIAVPWGHIAAREWGDASSLTKVLCLHGWQDNANSFEPLVQYFPPGFHVVAIDFPGHGLSSHLPLGMAYNFSDWVVHVRRVTKDLQWKHCHIVAHSMGASVAMLYSGTFPEAVESFVCFDLSSPVIHRVENGPDRLHEAADQIVKYDHEHYGLYDFEETVQRYIKSTFGSVTRESGVLLMERGTTADGQGVTITLPTRLTALMGTVASSQTTRVYSARKRGDATA
ncbi:PREDICTED: serine hydrolase-like protein [Priapulus caudatus]|uniref:Serine hydrolase-like protein n=1 Tax=Priapulus caudatus TaxID=37621 RepID=A0ABM1EQ29_PRICU|nr:PREDICTED: serine hydrolase-like protein [Priapulus caudatus]